eukprot:Blabericola_migrator_1__10437@NODE_5903_length_645_cov_863_690311_g3905_i0_p1_GENE_NODE_5903_length_645_cov_863_690311_g3905_i0NODE_5903_length_645_cov_863_690311_g3905_i0_p1_ORF_typecomplete_len124_score14_78C2/PF00168_30/2_5e13C2C2_1/PF11618_8/0_0063_NODE_5903_length_645_cov_863_690311_g3905_i099470
MPKPRDLHITVISAYNMPEMTSFRNITDPFVEIQMGAKRQITETSYNAGCEAEFDETFVFAYQGEHYLTVRLWDDRKKKAILLGEGQINLTPDILRQDFEGVIEVIDTRDRLQGEIEIAICAR